MNEPIQMECLTHILTENICIESSKAKRWRWPVKDNIQING